MNDTAWQDELSQVIRSPAELLELLELPMSAEVVKAPSFSLRVPRGYVARMRRGDPMDPLLRQVLPVVAERQKCPRFSLDPLGEATAQRLPGMLQKYQGRVLLTVAQACAIHCRYCFRQHCHYQLPQMAAVLETLEADTSIREVILSGGDPLMLTDDRLREWISSLATIKHLQRLRVHSRVPIVLPQRVTPTLVACLTETRLQPVLVVHTNHANELVESVGQALQGLVTAGVTVLNQAVLLRNVNDNIAALVALSETLFRYRVLPYYLHLLDRVQGTAHFEVPITTAVTLLEQLRSTLPGYLVPKMVREVVGLAYKLTVRG